MDRLREFAAMEQPVDLLLCNYVYEHVVDNTRHVISYKGILPEGRPFVWEECGKFPPSQNILMHSVIYRTQVLRDCGIQLPKHTFYVDNIFVYQPLPYVNTLYYLDRDLYRYYIGREDQSVNEKIMVKRVDQQVRITKIMIDAVDLYALPPEQKKLRAYMFNYLFMMMTISLVFLTMDGSAEALEEKETAVGLPAPPGCARFIKSAAAPLPACATCPAPSARKICLGGYRIAQKIFKFN